MPSMYGGAITEGSANACRPLMIVDVERESERSIDRFTAWSQAILTSANAVL